ncbi:hypothetical protein [Propionicicella superfundia]|uniref:hypothetical protein n=1 Tax=Propionicicella superfundia TaxID=348582 RepID=UPI000421FFBC|nr:hypothetical protein [Propionicicella superfundia]
MFAGLALVGLFTVLPMAVGYNDKTRMATIQAIVEQGRLTIDHTAFADTMDKVCILGQYFSDKPVTPQLLGALVYAPIHALGIPLHEDWSLAYYLITLLTVKLFWWLSLIAFHKALAYTGLPVGRRLLLTVALGVGTLVFSWSATFNNHSLAASWVTIGFWLLLRARHDGALVPNLALSGLFFGLAGGSDVPTLAFPAAFGAYLLSDRRLRRGAWAYAGALLVALAPGVAVNVAISGSVVPVQLVPRYFAFPGSPWTTADLTGAGVNSGISLLRYATTMLVGERGFLVYNPFSLLAIPLMVAEFVRRRRFAREALVVTAMSVVIVAFYALTSTNYGGYSYSIRWFVPMLPLWMFFLYPLLERPGRRPWAVFVALLAVSVPIAVIGTWNPWTYISLDPVPLRANLLSLPELARSLYDAILSAMGGSRPG